MRNYKVKDSILLELSDTIRTRFIGDLTVFTDFDKDLNQEFADTLQTLTNQALAEGGDTNNLSKLTGKTVTVNEAMDACNTYHKKLVYWVDKAFENNTAVQRQFGIGAISKLNRNQPKMIVFMENLIVTIQEYRVQLEAAGAPVELLDQAPGCAEELRTANIEQEQQKGSRVVDTAQRINLLNDIYSQLQRISTAANQVFADQPEKRTLYQIPYTTSSTPAIDTTQQ